MPVTLSKHQEATIMLLGAEGPKTATEIAHSVGLAKGINSMMTSLRERGFVTATGRAKGGPRSFKWALTEAGRTQYKEILATLQN